jgi:glycerate dehydrogenase
VRRVAVTFGAGPDQRAAISRVLGPDVSVSVVDALEGEARSAALSEADALLVWLWRREVGEEDLPALGGVGLVQLLTAGADSLPFDQVPDGAVVAANVGAYADPMAEHAMAMILALAKNLLPRHREMRDGTFNTYVMNRRLRGAVLGVLGHGGIGRATAAVARSFGMRIHAVNSTGHVEDEVEWAGTLDDLDEMLAASDVVLVSLPLTVRTRGLIGARELGLMKPDAIVVNVARGAIVDETALYEHLVANPGFGAGIDTWWREPLGPGGEFRMEHPFLDLPNVVGSPHNSAIVPGVIPEAIERAAANVARWLAGEPIAGVQDPADYTSGG